MQWNGIRIWKTWLVRQCVAGYILLESGTNVVFHAQVTYTEADILSGLNTIGNDQTNDDEIRLYCIIASSPNKHGFVWNEHYNDVVNDINTCTATCGVRFTNRKGAQTRIIRDSHEQHYIHAGKWPVLSAIIIYTPVLRSTFCDKRKKFLLRNALIDTDLRKVVPTSLEDSPTPLLLDDASKTFWWKTSVGFFA